MQQDDSIAAAILTFLALFLTGLFWYPPYTALSRGKAYLALLASAIACGVEVAFATGARLPFWSHTGAPYSPVLPAVAFGASIVFITAFVLRLWGRWVGGKASADEQQPGLHGIRAWFSASNVTVGIGIILCTWFGFGVSPLLVTVILGAALSVYPALRMETVSPAPRAPVDDLSVEREKIVSMLEAGKLTPEESAELLQALSETSRPSAQAPASLTPGQRLMLIGAALVTLGFFLPWFVINPGKEASRMMSQMNNSFASAMPMGDLSASTPQLSTPNVSISGGDIQRGLGWVALLLAMAAALIPYFAVALDRATSRMVRILCLGVGSLIVLYLLTENIRFVGIGLVIAVGGYILEIVGAFREPQIRQA